jgi:hypothetical protein
MLAQLHIALVVLPAAKRLYYEPVVTCWVTMNDVYLPWWGKLQLFRYSGTLSLYFFSS